MKNRLAHILHGNISVRVSNVTSAEGKALPIMQLAQDGLHLLSETKHDSSFCADSKEKQFVFQVGMKRKHSSFLDQNQKVVVASAYVLVQKSLVYVVWFNLRKIP